MNSFLGVATIFTVTFALLASTPQEKFPKPQYEAKGNLLRPADYRDWEFLSAGLGMNYSPTPGPELFTNVFVQRWAYQQFMDSGRWPEQTMFVVDLRAAQSKGSINKNGHFQTDLVALVVEIKDSAHNPDKWAYYTFNSDSKTAEAAPKGNTCFACHDAHAAVEHTFVQFYPTLKPVAKKFGTYADAREQMADAKE